MIIGFNVRANPQAREMAKRDNVEIRYYSIIYNVIDDVKAALSRHAGARPCARTSSAMPQIREVFDITKVGKVAGCMVTEGMVKRGAKVRLLRDNVVIHEGTPQDAEALQGRGARSARRLRMRHGVRELRGHPEVGDVIECFEVEEVARASV